MWTHCPECPLYTPHSYMLASSFILLISSCSYFPTTKHSMEEVMMSHVLRHVYLGIEMHQKITLSTGAQCIESPQVNLHPWTTTYGTQALIRVIYTSRACGPLQCFLAQYMKHQVHFQLETTVHSCCQVAVFFLASIIDLLEYNFLYCEEWSHAFSIEFNASNS